MVRNPAFADARPTGGARHSAAEAMGHVAVRPAGKLPAEKGWRRWLYLLSHINLGLSPDEIYERDLHARVRRIVTPPPGTVQGYQCAVVSLKGGVGKTSLTMLLGSVMAMIRGERALAVDANPDAGNLIQRASRQTSNTVAQLVSSAEVLTGYNAVREMTNQNSANLEVLAADDYVDTARSLEAQDWNTVTGVVSPFYPIVIADCGIGLHTAVTRAVLDSAWGLVVVSDASKDGATAAGQTFDWLRGHGYSDLASRAVAVVNHTKPGKGSADVEQIKERLAVEVVEGNVFELPYERHIEEGGEIDIRLVSSLMRRRITEIGAALSECFDKPRPGVKSC
jgi:MinD-like ATPase involved in chromosome partitioning or flagellar assembly